MMNRLVPLALFCLVLGTMDGVAQDDRPWWKALFNGQSSPVESAQVNPKSTPSLDSAGAVEKGIEMADEAEKGGLTSAVQPKQEGILGSVQWRISDEVAALDSAFVDPVAIRIPGFRVQVFMGRLDSARSLRHHLMQNEHLDHPVYVTPYPPLFGVTLGNFTSPLAAYRAREGLLQGFPLSLVVPLNLPLNAVYPESCGDIQDPQLHDTHRD